MALPLRVSAAFLTTRDTLGLIPEQIAFAESLGADGKFESLMPMPGLASARLRRGPWASAGRA